MVLQFPFSRPNIFTLGQVGLLWLSMLIIQFQVTVLHGEFGL